MSLMKDASRWGVEEIERAARQVLDSGLGNGASSIEPDQQAWSPDVAADLRHRIIDNADMGKGTFLSKLEVQLAGAARPTFLLAAELLFVHAAPLSNIGPATKRDRIRKVLSWLEPAPELPASMELALATAGVFNGGTGFNVGIWRQVGWLLAFLEHWWRQTQASRVAALTDPWSFREVVAAMPDQPGIRNSLLYLAFPRVFFPIVNQQHKNAIRNAFVSSIEASSGDDFVAVDRDLVAIRERQLREAKGEPVNYYFEPYLSQWWKQAGGPDVQRAWLVRPRQGGRELVQQWLADGFVSLQGEHLGAVPAHPDRQTMLGQVYADYQHLDYAQRVTLANEFHAFLSRMRQDDIVVTTVNDQVWIGTLEGDATYEANEPSTRLRRTVTWEPNPRRLSELDATAADSLDKQGTIVELTDTLPVWEDLGGGGAPRPVLGTGVVLPSRDAAALAASLHLPRAWLTELIDLLEERRQVILYGPPGTGKTYVADAVARHIAQDGAVRLVQFHPSYAYEDFFEGFRPSMADGQVGFRLAPGPLRLIAASAVLHPELPHVLIIDEINRANIAKVFGELYYLLEYRNKSIQLQYSPEEEFVLPPNLSIIGTMNTADKSIAVMDAAIRRRFAFVELHPDTEPVRDLLRDWLTSQGKAGDERVLLLRALNDALGEQEHDFKIGPSYLMTAEAGRPGGLERIWKHSILPLLHEHFYGRPEGSHIEERFGLETLRKSLTAPTTAP